MKKVLFILLIASLVLIDWLTFHDFLKGEHYTFTQYLTGIVSIPLVIILGGLLLKKRR